MAQKSVGRKSRPGRPDIDQIARNTKMFLFERLGVQLGSVGIFKSPKFRGLQITKRVSFSQVSNVMQSNYALQTLEIKMDMRALSAFLKKENFLRLTNDAVFKNFFTRDEELLKSLLQSFLPLPKNSSIESVVVLNPELTSERLASDAGKTFILDLKVKFTYQSSFGAKTETVNVEIQTSNQTHFVGRLIAYSGRIYSDQLDRGEGYEKLAPVYSLIFSTKNLKELAQVKDYFHVCSLLREDAPHVVISRALRPVIVELEKFSVNVEKLDNSLDKWCYVLKNSHKLSIEDCRVLLKGGNEMKNVLKNLWDLSLDPKVKAEALSIDKQRRDQHDREHYARNEGLQEGVQKGLEKGIQKGIQKGQDAKAMEIARKLLATGADFKFVSETTGLSLGQLQKLKKADP